MRVRARARVRIQKRVNVSPFITFSLKNLENPSILSLDEQADIFHSICYNAAKWTELENIKSCVILTAISSPSQFISDFQYDCSNVFFIRDTLEYMEGVLNGILFGCNT